MLIVGEAEPDRVLPVEGARLAEDALGACIVAVLLEAEVVHPDSAFQSFSNPVSARACSRTSRSV